MQMGEILMKKIARKPVIEAPKRRLESQPYKPQVRTKSLSERQAILWNEKLSKNEYTQRRLTFGQYVNVMIRDLPRDYIEWGILNLNTEWAEMFARELQRRDYKFRNITT